MYTGGNNISSKDWVNNFPSLLGPKPTTSIHFAPRCTTNIEQDNRIDV